MADIDSTIISNKKPGVRKLSKKLVRVDLTPMVDLGFILVSFFVFTSTLSSAKVLRVDVPNDSSKDINMNVCSSCALTLVLGDSNRIWYYEGEGDENIYMQTSYAASGLRRLISQKKQKVISARGSDQMQLIIKPAAGSTMKNLVDVMDEVNICVVKRYFLDEPTAGEMKKTEMSVTIK